VQDGLVRRLLTIVLCATLVGACGSDDDPSIAVSGNTTSTTVAGDAAPDDTAPPAAGEQPGGEPGAPPPATVAPTGQPATVPESPDRESAANGEAGSFARDILAGNGTIIVEVIAQQSAMPRQSTLAHVTETLGAVSGKPTTASVVGEPAPLADAWRSSRAERRRGAPSPSPPAGCARRPHPSTGGG
jgi:hypothetical protein